LSPLFHEHTKTHEHDLSVRGTCKTPNDEESTEIANPGKMRVTANRIAMIAPRTGQVAGWIDLTGLMSVGYRLDPEAVLNGIAYDSAHDRLFVTGKLWPRLFEIRVIR